MDTATRNWISTIVGGLVAVGVGTIDLFVFHRAGDAADIMFVSAGLAAFGLHVALTTNTDTALASSVSSLEQMHPPTG